MMHTTQREGTMLTGVRRQLSEARAALVESGAHAARAEWDPAYRAALRSRNLLFHAARGLAAARGEPMPQTPVTGGEVGARSDQAAALAVLDDALATEDEVVALPRLVAAARDPFARYLGWLKFEVAKTLPPPRRT